MIGVVRISRPPRRSISRTGISRGEWDFPTKRPSICGVGVGVFDDPQGVFTRPVIARAAQSEASARGNLRAVGPRRYFPEIATSVASLLPRNDNKRTAVRRGRREGKLPEGQERPLWGAATTRRACSHAPSFPACHCEEAPKGADVAIRFLAVDFCMYFLQKVRIATSVASLLPRNDNAGTAAQTVNMIPILHFAFFISRITSDYVRKCLPFVKHTCYNDSKYHGNSPKEAILWHEPPISRRRSWNF